MSKSEFIRRVLKWFFTLPEEQRLEVTRDQVEGPLQDFGWGSLQITYQIMTDSQGVQWKVPTHIDGEPCEYLRKHVPEDDNHTFDRITITEQKGTQ